MPSRALTDPATGIFTRGNDDALRQALHVRLAGSHCGMRPFSIRQRQCVDIIRYLIHWQAADSSVLAQSDRH